MGIVQPSPSDFDHFLLTRFNTRLEERASEEWLRHRIRYFESLCRASVLSQTNKKFRWLIYFDAERAEWFQKEVDRLGAGVFEPIWIDGPLTPEKAAAAVEERTSAPWVITTRVDNDDALARDFIEAVQAQFGREDHQFINFQAGLQMSDGGEVYYRSDPSGPFISLIERRTDKPLKAVYVGRHDKISEFGPIRQVVAHPMWLQMVHGLNIGNALRGIRAAPGIVGEYFDIEIQPAKISKIRLRISQLKTVVQLTVHVFRKPHRIAWVFRVAANRLVGRAS
ncbi:glycosyltransferase [Arthrobacter sp. B10-11]|uniref:glycosyltransferase n=1 Tax=Arthrobacter sp. B10-11 TaxID=3081160 RepID=UPI0029534521|nr:glycosyltransferase [Arthrobacter sp. B10-11]MDV8146979.1 glycosyltransferase [Arthrobacter sp. B10-11]